MSTMIHPRAGAGPVIPALTIMGRVAPPQMMKSRLAPDRSLSSTLSQREKERRCFASFIVMLALLIAPLRLTALEDDLEQPLYLESDSAELFEAKSMSIYTGNVLVRQGSMELRGDQVTIYHDVKRKPERIITIGTPATYKQLVEGEKQPVNAHALRMEYDRAKDEITLIDQAVLSQGKDTFRNDRIVYDRTKAQVKAGTIASGKSRVKITISPSRK